ncbi:MAG: bifunctional metallophosphatase/5'-nucleotidase [Candidatus Riflebacteria bacterium]|nr:bifunctional metallophosphatase/5'-nucleotidase [Candidatus Riflebacteria bacterium]
MSVMRSTVKIKLLSGSILLYTFLISVMMFSFELHAEQTRQNTITILYTNDTHSHLLPFDLPDFGKDVGGILRRKKIIDEEKKKNPAVFVFDAGDMFQGTAFYSFFKGESDVAAFSHCGYDATTLGNHEFDNGIQNVIEQYSKSSFPMICANIMDKETNKPVFAQYKIFERGGWKVGVTGIIGKQAWDVVPEERKLDVHFIEPETLLPEILKKLSAESDIQILLSHSGYDDDLLISAKFPEIDVTIGGHTNTYIEAPMYVKYDPVQISTSSENGSGGCIILQAFKWGVFLGKIDLTMNPDGKIATYSGELIKLTNSIQADLNSPLSDCVARYHSKISSLTSEVIGFLDSEMPYSDELKHLRDLALGRFTCDAMKKLVGADAAIINAGSIRSPLPAGNISLNEMFSAYPFENSIVVYTMKGKHLIEMMDFLCSNFGKISGYQYGGITGTMNIDIGKTENLLLNGNTIDPESEYKLATLSYLAEGNLHGKDMFKNALNKVDTGFLMRDSVLEYFKKNKSLSSPGNDHIKYRFAALAPFKALKWFFPGDIF